MTDADTKLPACVNELIDDLGSATGVAAVVLGGSRAQGLADDDSDWDLGVYYRGELDLSALERYGEVHPPGSWGRIMNGGAWLELEGTKVDVLLRDLDFVEECSARAERGEYDVHALLGYVVGVPTYSLMAELAICRVLRGSVDQPKVFPRQLVERAPRRWRFDRDFSLRHAHAHARRGWHVPAMGQLAKAVLEEAHARACEQGLWSLNEKRLIERTQLSWAHDWIADRPRSDEACESWIEDGAARLDRQ